MSPGCLSDDAVSVGGLDWKSQNSVSAHYSGGIASPIMVRNYSWVEARPVAAGI